MIRSLIISTLLAMGAPAISVAAEEDQATELGKLAGTIFGSLDSCALNYKKESVLAWFDARVLVSASVTFARVADLEAYSIKQKISEMSTLQLAVHCRAMEAKANAEGWQVCVGWDCL